MSLRCYFNKSLKPAVKEKVDDQRLCFICLQQVTSSDNKNENVNSLNFLFKYLKISGEIKEAFLCKNCDEKLAKFVKLCNILEKTRLELDYLFDLIQNAISNSNKNLKGGSLPISSVRYSVMKRCGEKVECPKANIILKRLGNSSSCRIDPNELSASPAIQKSTADANHILEVDLEDAPKTVRKKLNVYAPKPIKCPECSKMIDKRYLTQHINNIHLHLKPVKCKLCDESFSDNNGLKLHYNTIHFHYKMHKCDKCGMLFGSEESLKNHMIMTGHAPGQNLKEQSEDDETDMERKHEKSTILKKYGKKVDCPKAPIWKPSILQRRLNSHSTQTGSQLPTCCSEDLSPRLGDVLTLIPDPTKISAPPAIDKTTIDFKQLVEGILEDSPKKRKKKSTHTLTKCPMCSKTFRYKKSLQLHINAIHLNLRPFKCTLCGMSFREKHKLILHSGVHLDYKTYKCDTCGALYGREQSLIHHITAVHGKDQSSNELNGVDEADLKRKQDCLMPGEKNETKKIKIESNGICEDNNDIYILP